MSKVAESSASISKDGVGASVPAPLTLKVASALYRFEDVGAVFEIACAERVKVTVDAPGVPKGSTLSLPAGNWLIVGVGALAGMDCPHVAGVDNPYAPTGEVAA